MPRSASGWRGLRSRARRKAADAAAGVLPRRLQHPQLGLQGGIGNAGGARAEQRLTRRLEFAARRLERREIEIRVRMARGQREGVLVGTPRLRERRGVASGLAGVRVSEVVPRQRVPRCESGDRAVGGDGVVVFSGGELRLAQEEPRRNVPGVLGEQARQRRHRVFRIAELDRVSRGIEIDQQLDPVLRIEGTGSPGPPTLRCNPESPACPFARSSPDRQQAGPRHRPASARTRTARAPTPWTRASATDRGSHAGRWEARRARDAALRCTCTVRTQNARSGAQP